MSNEKILPRHLEIASQNGISAATVYRRVNQKHWTVEDAIAVPTNPKRNAQRKHSRLFGAPRGKVCGVRFPIEWEPEIREAIAQSGLTESDWIAETVGRSLGLMD